MNKEAVVVLSARHMEFEEQVGGKPTGKIVKGVSFWYFSLDQVPSTDPDSRNGLGMQPIKGWLAGGPEKMRVFQSVPGIYHLHWARVAGGNGRVREQLQGLEYLGSYDYLAGCKSVDVQLEVLEPVAANHK